MNTSIDTVSVNRATYNELLNAIALIPHGKLDTIHQCEDFVLAVDDVCRAHGWTFHEYSQMFCRKAMNEFAFLYASDELTQ
jgi:hypothetical protein